MWKPNVGENHEIIFLYVKELHSRKHQLPILQLQLEGGSNLKEATIL